MEFALVVYLAGIVNNFAGVLFAISLVALTIYGLYRLICAVEYGAEGYKSKVLVFSCIASLIISTLIPSERTIYLMAGAYLGQQVIQSSTASKVKQVIEMKLDEIIVETSSKSKK